GEADAADAEAFRAHMLVEFARMSLDDGLVMQLHPGAVRNHNRWLHARHGRDVGGDIPQATEYVHALAPLLERYGNDPRLRVVLYTLDEDTFTRELAPLAGGYAALLLGAPWWFLDSPEVLRRFRETVTETAGFYNTTGFVDDTRAFCSIPVRHDVARRVDAGFLARLVAEHRLPMDEAAETIVDLAYRLPKRVFNFGKADQ
ncbi:glucuronate isomerase, partial [Micromonospora zamorensis]